MGASTNHCISEANITAMRALRTTQRYGYTRTLFITTFYFVYYTNAVDWYSTVVTASNNRKESPMNHTIDLLMNRRTHRSFKKEPIRAEHRELMQKATLRAPTAGNMMFYSVIEVTDQQKLDKLALLCDNQGMIATAPLVWLFLSDVRKWVNYYKESGSVEKGESQNIPWRAPGAGDLLLAMSDALIAAQTAVIAA